MKKRDVYYRLSSDKNQVMSDKNILISVVDVQNEEDDTWIFFSRRTYGKISSQERVRESKFRNIVRNLEHLPWRGNEKKINELFFTFGNPEKPTILVDIDESTFKKRDKEV